MKIFSDNVGKEKRISGETSQGKDVEKKIPLRNKNIKKDIGYENERYTTKSEKEEGKINTNHDRTEERVSASDGETQKFNFELLKFYKQGILLYY